MAGAADYVQQLLNEEDARRTKSAQFREGLEEEFSLGYDGQEAPENLTPGQSASRIAGQLVGGIPVGVGISAATGGLGGAGTGAGLASRIARTAGEAGIYGLLRNPEEENLVAPAGRLGQAAEFALGGAALHAGGAAALGAGKRALGRLRPAQVVDELLQTPDLEIPTQGNRAYADLYQATEPPKAPAQSVDQVLAENAPETVPLLLEDLRAIHPTPRVLPRGETPIPLGFRSADDLSLPNFSEGDQLDLLSFRAPLRLSEGEQLELLTPRSPAAKSIARIQDELVGPAERVAAETTIKELPVVEAISKELRGELEETQAVVRATKHVKKAAAEDLSNESLTPQSLERLIRKQTLGRRKTLNRLAELIDPARPIGSLVDQGLSFDEANKVLDDLGVAGDYAFPRAQVLTRGGENPTGDIKAFGQINEPPKRLPETPEEMTEPAAGILPPQAGGQMVEEPQVRPDVFDAFKHTGVSGKALLRQGLVDQQGQLSPDGEALLNAFNPEWKIPVGQPLPGTEPGHFINTKPGREILAAIRGRGNSRTPLTEEHLYEGKILGKIGFEEAKERDLVQSVAGGWNFTPKGAGLFGSSKSPSKTIRQINHATNLTYATDPITKKRIGGIGGESLAGKSKDDLAEIVANHNASMAERQKALTELVKKEIGQSQIDENLSITRGCEE